MRAFIGIVLLSVGCSSGSAGSSPDFASSADLASPADLAPVTWSNFGQTFFENYCVSCHSPGGGASTQDFAEYAVVKTNAATIRCGTAPAGMLPSGCTGSPAAAQFPIGNGPKPTDAERRTLVGWIDAGAPM